MPKRTKLDANSIRRLPPGGWQWADGIGYRRHKTGDGGTWYIRYRVPVGEASGQRPGGKTRSVEERVPHCQNRIQAQGVLEERRSAIFRSAYQPELDRRRITLGEFVVRFLSIKRHLRSIKKYEKQLGSHLQPFFGDVPLVSITREACKQYYNARLETDAAIATVNGELACLKSLFSEAIDAGICDTNPVKAVRFKNPNNTRDRLLSSGETRRLFAAADACDDYVRPLFYMLYFTGMRLGEVLALRWSDVEFDHVRIVVREAKSGEGRLVPAHETLVGELHRWRPFCGGSEWAIPSPADLAKPLNSIHKGWDRLRKAAKVEDLNRHDLRHNFVSRLQAEGVSDSIIMDITGHKTAVMLYRYSHTNDDIRRRAVASLSKPSPPAKVIPLRSEAEGE